MLNRLLFALCLASCHAVGLSACGGASGGNVPVDSPLIQFEPPDSEDLVSSEDPGEDGSSEDSGGEPGEDSGGQ